MAGKSKHFKYINYIVTGSESIPVDSLTPEQKEKVLTALQDSFMASQGYTKLNNNSEQKESF